MEFSMVGNHKARFEYKVDMRVYTIGCNAL